MIFWVLTVVVAAGAVEVIYEKVGKRALTGILSDAKGLVDKLEAFKARKELEIADHLEEIALHQSKVSVKGSEAARATRIRDRITELLN